MLCVIAVFARTSNFKRALQERISQQHTVTKAIRCATTTTH
ncbi:MAG: hypothetical protein NTZ37_09590 [Methanoregula sp.]|nr:hypothetical protein [Methanoregula sp.]